jgi:hypothetical protein
LIFHRRAALDKLGERLLDANRTIGQPNKLTVIFGRKITKQYCGKLQTEIDDIHLPSLPAHRRCTLAARSRRREPSCGNSIAQMGRRRHRVLQHMLHRRPRVGRGAQQWLLKG